MKLIGYDVRTCHHDIQNGFSNKAHHQGNANNGHTLDWGAPRTTYCHRLRYTYNVGSCYAGQRFEASARVGFGGVVGHHFNDRLETPAC